MELFSVENLKSKSTIVGSVVSTMGLLYSAPPTTLQEWIIALISTIVGIVGFIYKEKTK